jgi:3D (Asp-Asp-Asp) domain-containing protein
MKAIVSRSAIIASMLLVGLVVFSAKPSIAETLLFQFQSQKQESKQNPAEAVGKAESVLTSVASTRSDMAEQLKALVPATPYVATAYSLKGRTASGRMVSRGLIAADPAVLPLGSRVRLEHPGYSGEYIVADTGGAIRGRRIDIWTPSSSEAMRFGRRTVKLTVLSYGARRSKRTAKGALPYSGKVS